MPDLILAKHTRPVMEDQTRHKTIVAHRRWGKTSYGIKKLALRGLENPGGRYFFIAPTYKQAKMIAWGMAEDYLRPLEIVKDKSETELRIELKTNSVIELKGADYPDSLRGVGLDGAVLDEWSMQKPEIFTEILRPALADKKGWSDKLLTPKGKNHAYDDFMSTDRKHIYPASSTGVIPADELAAMKLEMSPDEYAQEMECNFLYHSGAIYREFRKEIHVVDPFAIPEGWNIKIGLDWGLTNPTAILFGAIDYDDNLYIADEIYQNDTPVDVHSRNTKDKMKLLRGNAGKDETIRGVIDPKCKALDQVKGGIRYSIQQEFANNGIGLACAPNAVIAGINLVKQMLVKRKLFIFSRCENTIRELENYRWKEKRAQDSENPEEPLKVEDHACLVGETLVKMAGENDRKIEKINIGDRTSEGIVVDKAMTGIKPIWELILSDGKRLRSTADHKIFTDNGKKPLDTLSYGDKIRVWQISIQKEALRLTDYPTIGTDFIIPQLAGAPMGGNACTLQFGNILMAKCLMAFMSTIKTSILKTTIYPILSLLQRANIFQSMPQETLKTNISEENQKDILRRSGHLRSSGIDQQREEKNIDELAGYRGTKKDIIPRNVWCAGKIIRHLSRLVRGIATLIVEQRPFVVGVRPLNYSAPVYNLTVENSHQFYANGILVANCDALRYLVSSQFQPAKRPPEPEPTDKMQGRTMKRIAEIGKKREDAEA